MIWNNIKPFLKFFLSLFTRFKIIIKKQFKLSAIYQLDEEKIPTKKNNTLKIIVFSKDRPLQLLALLESLQYYSSPKILPYVIYNAKDEQYEKAYQELFQAHSNLIQGFENDKQSGFKITLIKLIEMINSDAIVYFVDDILIKNYFSWNDFLKYDLNFVVPTLRLGNHLTFCYTANATQTLPPLKSINNKLWFYWHEGEHDWNYPLSLDGNIFNRLDFLEMTRSVVFKAPNSLELQLRNLWRHKYLPRLGLCCPISVIVNNPINKVQKENNNFHGSIHQDTLLRLWQEGKKIDFKYHENLLNKSCHQELEIKTISKF